MRINRQKLSVLGCITAAVMCLLPSSHAATSLVNFGFDEGTGTTITDTINSLSGSPGDPANPPTFEASSPSGRTGDSSIHFETGQYMIVNDPDTRLKLNTNNPSFTLQAWVKFDGNPAGRQVFYYANGPGGALSFSVNVDRTVFVTTLGIADVSSQAAIPDDGAWHHIAVVHEAGKELRFYVDGVLGDTVPYTNGVNFTRTQTIFSIGSEWNGALQYIGSVDRLKVSSGILPPEHLDYLASAPVRLVDFGFDEGSGTAVADSINSLSGGPGDPANPPTFLPDSPSAQAADSSMHFEAGQYMVVNDPDTRLQLNTNNPAFTLQAWVKFDGNPAGRQVFYYGNGPGGALSFSVNVDRTVFVTTLGIADVSSQAAIPDDGAWHHIAVVHDPGKELRFYVDGVLGDTVPYTSGVNFTRTQKLFSIGAEWNGALQYLGSVDRLKISSGILRADQLDFQAVPPARLIDFPFDEGAGTTVTDTINSLSGTPGDPANPPTFQSDAPSGKSGDSAVHFEAGQYFTVNDPDTRLRLNTNNPSFTLQAWVKFDGNPAGRQVFYYANGPGGALSFSVNNDRTVFVTTLGIADVSSQAAIPDDGAWHHIAVVHDPGKTLRFYVDGVLGDTVDYTGGVNFTRTQTLFSIGAEWNGALQYLGSLDRLKVFSGMLGPDQLDYQSVPTGGDGGLIIARPGVTAFGFSIGVTDAAGTAADTNTIALSFNGGNVAPTSVSKSGFTTTISYAVAQPLPSGSTNTVTLVIKDTKGTSYTNSATFVTPSYATLSLAAALPDSAVDKTDKGFKIRVYQTDGGTQDGTIAYNEDLLAGLKGDNVANLDDAGGVDSRGYFTVPDVINFDTTPGAANGYFNDPDYPSGPFPGIPGTVSTGVDIENFVEEIVAALEFKTPGMYTMAVNTDWTGFPNATDGYLVRAGVDPLNPASSTVLGYYDANAPAGPERGIANSPFQFYVPRAGIYPFRLMYYQSAGSANLEWFLLNPDGTRTLINDPVKADAIPAYFEWTAPPQAPGIAITRTTDGVTITFTGALEETSDLPATQWQPVTGSGQVTVPTTGARRFFRAKQ